MAIYVYFLYLGPSVPKLLVVVGVTNTSVTLSWNPPDQPNGIITQYQVQYRKRGSFKYLNVYPVNTDLPKITGLTHTVTGLIHNAEYMFRVRASTVMGYGPFTSIKCHTGKISCLNLS